MDSCLLEVTWTSDYLGRERSQPLEHGCRPEGPGLVLGQVPAVLGMGGANAVPGREVLDTSVMRDRTGLQGRS